MDVAPPPPPPSPKQQRRNSSASSFLSSDSAHTVFLLSQSFAAAYAPYLLLPPFLFFASLRFFQSSSAAAAAAPSDPPSSLLVPAASALLLLLLAKLWWRPAPRIYLVDFAAFKPRDEYRLTTHQCAKVTREASRCSLRNMFFQLKVLLKSGLGDDVYGAPYLFKEHHHVPTLKDAQEETQMMMFGAVDQLLAKTGVSPSSIDILIVAVSMFSPSPSLASHLVSHYRLRHDIKSFNLSGMGCAAGLAAVDLARRLLLRRRRPQSALLVCTENTTLNFYPGDDRSMLVANCLFRCGGHALLLSNYAGGGPPLPPPKMELLETIRTTTAASDRAYQAIFTREDEAGIKGTALGVELMEVAAEAAAATMARLAPGYMPLGELWRAAVEAVAAASEDKEASEDKGKRRRRRRHVADWRKAFEHVCVHPGGKAVVEGMGKRLGLSEVDVEASKMALQRFGNTSGSGIWYALAYCEAKERLKKGDKVLQLALGSGFKCNAAVWKVLRHLRRPLPGFNPWSDCIDSYPVAVPDAIDASHPHFAFYKLMEQELRRLEHSTTTTPLPSADPSFPFDSLLQHLQQAGPIQP